MPSWSRNDTSVRSSTRAVRLLSASDSSHTRRSSATVFPAMRPSILKVLDGAPEMTVIRNIVLLEQGNRHASEWSHLWKEDFKPTRETVRAPAKLRGPLSDLADRSATFRERIAPG